MNVYVETNFALELTFQQEEFESCEQILQRCESKGIQIVKLQNILQTFDQTKNSGQSIALATLVKAQGSTYRRPGARMLMTSGGQMVGSLSGGCLEGDVFEQAQAVMTSGQPIVVEYNTMSDEDIIWGLGLGCNGIVQILIEQIEPENPFNPLTFLSDCIRHRRVGVLATVFQVEGEIETKMGTRLILYSDGKIESNIQNTWWITDKLT